MQSSQRLPAVDTPKSATSSPFIPALGLTPLPPSHAPFGYSPATTRHARLASSIGGSTRGTTGTNKDHVLIEDSLIEARRVAALFLGVQGSQGLLKELESGLLSLVRQRESVFSSEEGVVDEVEASSQAVANILGTLSSLISTLRSSPIGAVEAKSQLTLTDNESHSTPSNSVRSAASAVDLPRVIEAKREEVTKLFKLRQRKKEGAEVVVGILGVN